jgi:hypothetical protein
MGSLQYVREHYVFLPSQFAHPEIPLSMRTETPPMVSRTLPLPSADSTKILQFDPSKWRALWTQPPQVLHDALDRAPPAMLPSVLELGFMDGVLPNHRGLLTYFQDVLVTDRSDTPVGWRPTETGVNIRGHILGRPIAACWDVSSKTWEDCADVVAEDVVRAAYQRYAHETFAPYVGYVDDQGAFKIIDRTVRKKSTSKAIFQGKTCKTFKVQELEEVIRLLGLSSRKDVSQKDILCEDIETKMRQLQIEADWSGKKTPRCFFPRIMLPLFEAYAKKHAVTI